MNYIEEVRSRLASKIDVEPELLDLYTLLALRKGKGCSYADVHDAWSIWRTKTDPNHKSIVPFAQLPKHVQMLDAEYADAIRDAVIIT